MLSLKFQADSHKSGEMLITEFFANQEIFLTGGSGFIGKGLVEKLLRDCPKVGKIYLLLRAQKDKSAEERLRELLKDAVFNRLRQENPHALDKVHMIEGDCSELGLRIKAEDLEKLKTVTIIYHAAASVRFDDSLRDAILLNTRGTHELVKIAETLPQLKVFVHVSTTYCNPDKHVVEEQVYPPLADWRTTIKLAETYDTETLNIFNLKYGNNQPNTYTFTKSLSEQVINDYRNKLPVIIFRPSIVVSSIEEPKPGWVDNFNGPLGLLVACGIGILRTNYGNPDIISDFIPVDVVTRTLITSCYKKGMEGQKKSNTHDGNEVQVFNCASASLCTITMGQILEIGKTIVKDNPFERCLWKPGGNITRCYVWNLIRFIFLHIFTAMIIDCILRFTNGKPFLLKLQRRIYAANLALHVFITSAWDFRNVNFHELNKCVPEAEISKFAFLDYSRLDYEAFFRQGLRGAKEYLLHEPPDSTDAARFRYKILCWLHLLVQLIFGLLITRFAVRFIYSKISMS